MKKALEKLNQHKGKGANVLEFNPEFVSKVSDAKETVKKAIVKEVLPIKEVENTIPTKEDFTASEYVGVTVYIDEEPHRLTIKIDQRDKLMGISENLAYIKREGGGSQVDVLLMLDCADRFGEKEELYERCIDLVFEDFESDTE
jgi:hypothetical protein